MKWTKKMKGAGKKAAVTVTALGMVLTAFPPIPAKAAEEFAGQLTSVESVEKGSKDNIVVVKFNGGVTAQLTFLEDGYAEKCAPFNGGKITLYNFDDSADSRSGCFVVVEYGNPYAYDPGLDLGGNRYSCFY